MTGTIMAGVDGFLCHVCIVGMHRKLLGNSHTHVMRGIAGQHGLGFRQPARNHCVARLGCDKCTLQYSSIAICKSSTQPKRIRVGILAARC